MVPGSWVISVGSTVVMGEGVGGVASAVGRALEAQEGGGRQTVGFELCYEGEAESSSEASRETEELREGPRGSTGRPQ